MRVRGFIGLFAVAVAASAYPQEYESDLSLDHPAIRYWEGAPSDAVSTLIRDVAAGRVSLEAHQGGLSYLPSLLRELSVGAESQTLVFAKNSLQKNAISPRTPRAIYFNDEVSIGFVPGGDAIELAGIDPRQGAVFYTLRTGPDDEPVFERPRLCLACHRAAATVGVAGIYVSSVATTPAGRTEFRLGTIVTDHRTPIAERWGGWYVDGAPDDLRHRGNAVSRGPAELERATAAASAIDRLRLLPNMTDYIEPASDVVALMIFEHQTQLTNFILRIGWEARIAEHEGEPFDRDRRTGELARLLLFTAEAPLPAAIQGASSFAQTFPRGGPRDGRGRSLRELDLESRLFRYPLSYMVDSKLFAALPGTVREETLRVVYDALTAPDSPWIDSTIPAADRRAAVEIVRASVADLPSFWR